MNWDLFIRPLQPKTMLEIGSYEGAATCYLFENFTREYKAEIHCIDTWEGGLEHQLANVNMNKVEELFDKNINLALSRAIIKPDFYKHKCLSFDALNNLYFTGKVNYFDFIYIDGSHLPEDVLADAVLSFKLLKPGGIIGFDDYQWGSNDLTINYVPKTAIDAFINIYFDYIEILIGLSNQIYIRKISNKKRILKGL